MVPILSNRSGTVAECVTLGQLHLFWCLDQLVAISLESALYQGYKPRGNSSLTVAISNLIVLQ